MDAIGKSGEHAVGLFSREVSPLAALKRISGNPNIAFAVADDMTGTLVPADVLSYNGKLGLMRTGPCGMQTDAQLNFTVKGGNALPPNSTCTWKGALTVSRTGSYWLYLQALGVDASISVDGNNVGATGAVQGDHHGDVLEPNQDNIVPTTDGLDNVRRAVELSAGPHTIEIDVRPDTSKAPAQIRLNWYTPEQREIDYAAAIAAARKARIAVVFAWERPEADPVFALPGDQDKLIDEIAAVNPNTIVVLNTSQPVALPWAGKVKAILEMWFPGDEGGWSTANVLLGKVSPAGRLPITWGRRLEDYPATDPRYPERSFKGVDGKTIYSEGVNIGYRWFDKEKIEPLYPFGFGLSYTSFAYSSLKIAKSSDGGLDVKCQHQELGENGVRRGAAGLSRRAPEDPPRRSVPGPDASGVRSRSHSCRGIEGCNPTCSPATASILVNRRWQVGWSRGKAYCQRRFFFTGFTAGADHRLESLLSRAKLNILVACPIVSGSNGKGSVG